MANRTRKPVTTTTLAQKLGVSRATVSYVLSGKAKQYKISDRTAKRVLDAARELDYQPNALARGLRLQRSGIVGFLTGSFTFDWAERVLTGMLEVLDAAGSLPFITMHRWSPELEERALSSLLTRQADGVICVPLPGREQAYRRLLDRGVPMVFLGDIPEGLEDASYVAWDVARAARKAVEHLASTGRRRLGFMAADHRTVMTRARYEAFEAVCRAAGISVRPEWVAWEPVGPFPCPAQMVERMISRVFAPGTEHPDGLFFGHDALAVRALDRLEAMGIRVPDDVAVVSLSDLLLSDHSGISLSTVREPSEAIGRRAAEVMLTLIEAWSSSTEPPDNRRVIQELVSSDELIVRHTTAGVKKAAGAEKAGGVGVQCPG